MENSIVSGIAAAEKAAETYRAQTAEYRNRTFTGKPAVSFQECMDQAAGQRTTVFPEGEDVVMAHPPACRTNYNVDRNKSREEMTMDEYKQYICNVVSSLPVSDSMRACSSGVLIFKEEAFESMKNDQAYENEVIRMLREGFSAQLPGYAPNVGYQVIGKTREECYGEAIPLKSNSWMLGLQDGLASPALSASGLSGLGAALSGLLASGSGLVSSGLLNSGLGLASSGLLNSGLGLASSGLLNSGLGLASSGLLNSGLGLGSYGLLNSGLGLVSSGLLNSGLGLVSSGLSNSGRGLSSSGSSASGLSPTGLASAGRPSAGGLPGNRKGVTGGYGSSQSSASYSSASHSSTSRANMINAYKNAAKNWNAAGLSRGLKQT